MVKLGGGFTTLRLEKTSNAAIKSKQLCRVALERKFSPGYHADLLFMASPAHTNARYTLQIQGSAAAAGTARLHRITRSLSGSSSAVAPSRRPRAGFSLAPGTKRFVSVRREGGRNPLAFQGVLEGFHSLSLPKTVYQAS